MAELACAEVGNAATRASALAFLAAIARDHGAVPQCLALFVCAASLTLLWFLFSTAICITASPPSPLTPQKRLTTAACSSACACAMHKRRRAVDAAPGVPAHALALMHALEIAQRYSDVLAAAAALLRSTL
jgi:hypothetical protein